MKKTMELLMFHGDVIFPTKFTLRCLGDGGAPHPDVMAEIMGEQIIIVVDSG